MAGKHAQAWDRDMAFQMTETPGSREHGRDESRVPYPQGPTSIDLLLPGSPTF